MRLSEIAPGTLVIAQLAVPGLNPYTIGRFDGVEKDRIVLTEAYGLYFTKGDNGQVSAELQPANILACDDDTELDIPSQLVVSLSTPDEQFVDMHRQVTSGIQAIRAGSIVTS